MDQLFKMDYSAVSQVAKRFEQESKVNHKIREVKQKVITALRENSMSNVENLSQNYFTKKVIKISSPDKTVMI
ncbi:MAG: hypothetical protein KAW87_02745 [Candidatus Cloacimonetes bacterium]|nr:hypothetical protein [Candidatus Cloacimonadota bacterium]